MNWPAIGMALGAIVWLAGELLAVFTGRAQTDTTSAWIWTFEGKTGWSGRALVATLIADLFIHLVFGTPLFHPWSRL